MCRPTYDVKVMYINLTCYIVIYMQVLHVHACYMHVHATYMLPTCYIHATDTCRLQSSLTFSKFREHPSGWWGGGAGATDGGCGVLGDARRRAHACGPGLHDARDKPKSMDDMKILQAPCLAPLSSQGPKRP